MKSKAPSYLRQLAQPVPAGGTVLSAPRRARGRVSEKFGLAAVPVIQDAEDTIAAPLMSRHVPVAVSAAQRVEARSVAEVEEPAARRIVTSRFEVSRRAFAVEKDVEVRLERRRSVIAPGEEAAVAQAQRRIGEAALDVRGTRERSVSVEGVQPTASAIEAAAMSRSVEKRETERKEAAKDAAVEMHREVLRVERERVMESEVRPLEAKPQRAPQPAVQMEPKPAERQARIHIGTVEVRVVSSPPPAPAPAPQRTVESQPARLAPPAPAPSLSHSLAWNYGLVQG